MKIRYRIPVTGRTRLKFHFPVRADLFTYEFEIDKDGLLHHLSALASVPDRSMWPVMQANPEPGVAANIILSSPFFEILQRDLRAVVGVLSLFGIDDIDLNNVEESWESESPEEKAELKIYSFKREMTTTSPSTWPCVSFDIVARAFLSAHRSSDFETALHFFRKGRIDVQEEKFLDAVLDFLFMVETTYAEGKFRTTQVEAAYLSNSELQALIAKALREPGVAANVRGHVKIQQAFDRDYRGHSPAEITKHLVNLRGSLHHHTSRKQGVWHPTDHTRFGADAYFLQHLCMEIGFSITNPTLFAEEFKQAYLTQAAHSQRDGLIVVSGRNEKK